MESEDRVITIDDVHKLVDAKYLDPQIAPQDLYRQVDKVRADNSKEMWKSLWIPLVLAIVSVTGMLFCDDKNGNIYRLSIISFLVSGIWGISILKRFGKQWWWIPILAVVVLYIVMAESLSIKELLSYVTSLL